MAAPPPPVQIGAGAPAPGSLREQFDSMMGPGIEGVMPILIGGVVSWFVISALILMSPMLKMMVTKDSKGVTELDVVERVTGFVHAGVSGGIGVWAWLAVPVAQCRYDPETERVLRFGVALTMSYIIYDWLLLVAVEVAWKIRDVWWTMWIHHANILSFFAMGLLYNQVSWFLAAHLVNELSSMPINICYFMKNYKMDSSPLFMLSGGSALLTFFVMRVVAIPAIAVMFYRAGQCASTGMTANMAYHAWVVIMIHWGLNCYWFGKMVKLAMKTKKESPPKMSEQEGEKLPLIASEAGLGPMPETDPKQLARDEEEYRGR